MPVIMKAQEDERHKCLPVKTCISDDHTIDNFFLQYPPRVSRGGYCFRYTFQWEEV